MARSHTPCPPLAAVAIAAMAALLTLAPAPSAAALSLTPLYASSMVLQRGAAIPLWGDATPGATVSVKYRGATVTNTSDATGRWQVTLAASAATAVGATIVISSSSSADAPLTLTDVVVGDVHVCSGQSNMGLAVMLTYDWHQYANESTQLGNRLRVMQVDTSSNDHDITTPHSNFTANIPWSRASPTSVPAFSAACYYYGRELALARPDVPVGLINSAWGGTAINVWMDATSLASCGVKADASPDAALLASNPDPGLGYAGLGDATFEVTSASTARNGGVPSNNTELYNTMLYPLMTMPLTGFLWYQGEANSGAPSQYACLFPAMISQWRAAWHAHTAGATSLTAPFLFVQLSAWPAGNDGTIATIRYAQTAALKLPNVGMAVAGDIGDPAGVAHPIHPPFKQEVGRRAYLAAEHIIYGNTSVPAQGPLPVSVTMDMWDKSWGEYHYETGTYNVCTNPGWMCFGLRVKFDQPVTLDQRFGTLNGWHNGFKLWGASGASYQVLALTGVRTDDATTVQLNATWVAPSAPSQLQYAWDDYPTMPVVDTVFGRPAPQFNVTVAVPPSA